MTDEEIRSELCSALDATSVSSAPDVIARVAMQQGERALRVAASARSLWWLCAAAALLTFVSVGVARREHRSAALSTAEALWTL